MEANEFSLDQVFKVVEQVEKDSPHWKKIDGILGKGYLNNLQNKLKNGKIEELCIEIRMLVGHGMNADSYCLHLDYNGIWMASYKELDYDSDERIRNLYKRIGSNYGKAEKAGETRTRTRGTRFVKSLFMGKQARAR